MKNNTVHLVAGAAICGTVGAVMIINHNGAPMLTPTTFILGVIAICLAVVGGWQ